MYNKYLKTLNFNNFTPIQKGSFKHFNENKNFVGIAPTGTGKTHAYLIPLIENINKSSKKLEAIIVVPTNELINQVYNMLKEITNDEIRVRKYDARTNKERELDWLTRNNAHIIISTPEKLNDYSNDGLNLKELKYFILDEADMMFDEYFLREIDDLANKTKSPKFLLYSATINQNMHKFIRKFFGAYTLIDTTKEHNLNITQKLIRNFHKDQKEVILNLTNLINPYLAIIFVSRKKDQIELFNYLKDNNVNVGILSGDLNIRQRKNALKDIFNLKYQYVVASDLAARGIDFDASHIINYDLPNNLEFFKHRSGRTGRMEKEGIVITISTNEDRHKITRLKEMGINFLEYKLTKNGLTLKPEKEQNTLTKEELNVIKKIPKPKKVKPNYRKKNKKRIKETLRRKRNKNVKNR